MSCGPLPITMATKKTKTTGHGWQVHTVCFWGICVPVGFNVPSNAALQAGPITVSGKGASISSGVGAGIAGAISGAAGDISKNVWKSLGSHAWEVVIGGAMVLVLIGSAIKIGKGGL
jgi:hypothetical protein